MLNVTDHGPIREVTLSRPPANALNPELVEALHEALSDAAESAGAVVVSGAPGMFSAGLDVPELMRLGRGQLGRFWQNFQSLTETIAKMPVPTVFALTGHAPAGGIVMALFADYRIMARGSFKTGLNEVQVGLVVPPTVYRALVRLVGSHRAERITVAGEMMEAHRALDIGLVDELADDAQAVVKRAIAWCEQHLALPQHAMLQTRAMARADLHRVFDEARDVRSERFEDVWFRESTQATLNQLVARLAGR
jgi:enoyl-CoA hydratase/carnithine racemase